MQTNYEVMYDAATQGVPVKSWARGVPFNENAKQQLRNTSTLPFIHKWCLITGS